MTVALEQHNAQCDFTRRPYPETWGGVNLASYRQVNGEVWVPLAHFRINLDRVAALSFRSLFDTSAISIDKIEFTATLPAGLGTSPILSQAPLYTHCSDPSMIALAFYSGRLVVFHSF